MPTSEYVDFNRQSHISDNGRGDKRRMKRREGIPIDLSDTSSSILSPIISHLPSFAGMTSLKGFLPTSPTKQPVTVSASEERRMNNVDRVKAIWQEGDIGDGRGKIPLLLVTSKSHALQIFTTYNNTIPDDRHIPESFPAPEEIASIPSIQYNKNTKRSSVEGVKDSAAGVEQVISMTLLDNKGRGDGLLVAMIVRSSSGRKASNGSLALVVVNVRTGLAVRRIELGSGTVGAVYASNKVVAVTVSQPIPSIHLFCSNTFEPLPASPLTHISLSPVTGLPIISLSGRLLVFATSEAPHAPGSSGLGCIITSSTIRSSRPSSSERRRSSSGANDTQAAILSSAVEIGGGVARGVWAGLKMGAKAANRARNTRLAKSAPSDSSGVLVDDEILEVESESRSLDESSVMEDLPISSTSTTAGGEWIKVVDLFPRPARNLRAKKVKRSYSTSRRIDPEFINHQSIQQSSSTYETIAHFRLPPSSSSLPIDSTAPHQPRRLSNNRNQPIAHLSFSPNGAQLLAAPNDGKSFHILEVHPAGIDKADVKGEVKGQVWHLYELRRGHTAATVKEVTWDRNGRWVGVGTGKGTIHVFPITPSGGPPSASTHATDKIVNPSQLYPLSTVVTPSARLRPRNLPHETNNHQLNSQSSLIAEEALFSFTSHRRHPLTKNTFCQDISVYRPSTNTLELARISVYPNERKKVPEQVPQSLQRRGSALTEMMKNKAFGEGSDLGVESGTKAAWNLPDSTSDPILLDSVVPLENSHTSSRPTAPSKSLAQAEIRTHCINPSILPTSIYISRQVEFFASKPIDEYSPLSIIDPEARQHKLLFRKEVQAFSPIPSNIKPFDEPLLTALHSILIEDRPLSQLPRLPNGVPNHQRRWTNTRIPIKSVTEGINEGVDRVRREYVKAQYIRSKKSAKEKAGLGLSFEDSDSISIQPNSFNSSISPGGDNDYNGSLPSSELIPTTSTSNTNSNSNTEPSDFDLEEWSEKEWEEEYNKAIEDDSPQELVLGLMDEEEEERRKWEIRRERLKKEYAK